MAKNDHFAYEVRIRAQERLSDEQLNEIVKEAVETKVRLEVATFVKERTAAVLKSKMSEIDSKILQILDERIFHSIFSELQNDISSLVDKEIQLAEKERKVEANADEESTGDPEIQDGIRRMGGDQSAAVS